MQSGLALLAALSASVSLAVAQPVRTANVEVELHSAREAVEPGERFAIVLRQRIADGWHTYWRNPGDSGAATEIDWRLPNGVEAGPIQWPTPEAIPFATLVNFGYAGEILFPVEISVPASARPGETITLTADVRWLVCSDICIPEHAMLTFSARVATRGTDDPVWAPRIRRAQEELPRRLPGVEARITEGTPARLSVSLPETATIRNVRFFPYAPDAVQAAAPQHVRVGARGVSFSLAPGHADDLGQSSLGGVVAFEQTVGGAWRRRGVEIEATPGELLPETDSSAAPMSADFALADIEGSASSPQPAGMDVAGVLLAAAFAFLGGLLLNLMPCVLPVLSIKALSLANSAHSGDSRREGALYFAGVMLTFLLLAASLLALRGAGQAIGWGFQLQAPWVTSALGLLFFAIGLNLLGVFSVGGALQGVGQSAASKPNGFGTVLTGALAVIAATPCTAPFMAGAVGAAMTQSPPTALVIFASLGLGFALPMTALYLAPDLRRFIPKPGAWTERLKQALAFPMFASAIWMTWVLAEQTGPSGVLALLSMAAALSFAVFVMRWGQGWRVAGACVVLVTMPFAWRPLFGLETRQAVEEEAWSPARVEALRAEGRPIFVNFTAAWCVTCKLNEATTLGQQSVQRAFARTDTAYLVADWTNRDDEIARALADHGRAGVPLYLVYPAGGGEPRVLPQILSSEIVVDALEQGAQ